jgi:uncharacterized protein (DUF1800 family)
MRATVQRLVRTLPLILGLAAAPALSAAPQTVWLIGVDEDPLRSGYNPTDEFSSESGSFNKPPGRVTRRPEDPFYGTNNPAKDDDHYLAGTFPIGFNGLTTNLVMAVAEDDKGFERAITTTDPTNRVHFILTPTQAGAESRLRLSFELINGGFYYSSPISQNGEGFGRHDVEVRFRSATATNLLWGGTVERDTRVTLDFAATNVAASAGPNTIEIVRAGPKDSGISHWVQFDFVQLEADTNALDDADHDGLPRWWEEDNHLSDSDPADAALDPDRDGLTTLQEFNGGFRSTDPHRADTDRDGLTDGQERALGTNPLLADTDGDGLGDFEEVNGSPASSPLLADTDGDGFSDAWEKRMGTNPNSASSKPTVFRGAIGLHFVSTSDRDGVLATNDIAGVVPQTFWNETLPMRTSSRTNGGLADIAGPVTNRLTRSDGATVPGTTFGWIAAATSASQNNASPDQRVMDGLLRSTEAQPVVLSLTNIPFAKYDLYVHVGGSSDGAYGQVLLNNDPATSCLFLSQSTAPESRFIRMPTGDGDFHHGNYVRYAGLTAANATITVNNLGSYGVGLHALQIVDAMLDSDGSGIPDWFEVKYGLQPGTPALAATDSDGDGLTNLQEFQRGSDPRNPDTDGDGLMDGEESAANALTADSDGDGLSDFEEVRGILPSNPNLADTDGDGVNDRDERRLGTDPKSNPGTNAAFRGWVPYYSPSPARWDWTLENVQLVWDHGTGGLAPNSNNEDTMVSFGVQNAATSNWRTLGMELRYAKGSLSYLFHSDRTGAFSQQKQPTSSIYQAEYGTTVPDLKAALGFSGYGATDISDRLRFRSFAQRAATTNLWTLTFEIVNQSSGAVVYTKTFTNSTATATVDNGSAVWRDFNKGTNLVNIVVHPGVRLFITPTPLESLAAFAAAKDSDNDGMPDAWEDTHGFNKNSAADAALDADNDGLNNRDEFLAGTDPRNRDTDGDGISDFVELANGSDPLSAAKRPDLAGKTWPFGEDLDGDGLPDAWAARYGAAGLPPDGDADGDGLTNAQEARLGTDPFDAASGVFLVMDRATNDVLLAWNEQPLKRQRLFSSTALTNWTQSPLVPIPGGGWSNVRLTNRFASAPFEFYRVETDDKDSDGDGVSDWTEMLLGTDAFRPDSSRRATAKIDSAGDVIGTVSGDYATMVQRLGQNGMGATNATRAQAARLLQQATFGPTSAELDRVQALGIARWIDDQITNRPPTFHRRYIEQIYADFRGARTDLTYSFNKDNDYINGNNLTTCFARAAIGGQDQLRQRVAFALSQILVTSRRDANLENRPLGMADYYDIFVRHAFGNYADILREVTFHPVMGRYLSSVGNQKARPEVSQFPDENYAREVQQLFTIGLWELTPGGTRKLDANGQPIATYGNREITEFARVFTGFWFGGQSWGSGGWNDDDYTVPMKLWAEKHDFAEKTLLRGFVIPARAPSVENATRDLDDALRCLFEHPNTAPFIGQQLIQFLITSNPSSNYVARIAAVFTNDGTGRRGNLAAVVKAVLIDPEARQPAAFLGQPGFGRLKEPVQRAMAIHRVGRLERHTNLVWWTWGEFADKAFQEPTYAPTVFNYFRPTYQPPGPLTDSNLVGPAFQILDSYSSISLPNLLWDLSEDGISRGSDYNFPPDYGDLQRIAADPAALVDEVNLLFCGGGMSAGTRDAILGAVNQLSAADTTMRVRLAVYLAATCPEGAVQR